MNVLNGSSALTRRLAVVVAMFLAVTVGFVAAPVGADTIEVEIPTTAVKGDPGTTVVLGGSAVEADLQGRSCEVAVVVTNQVSKNPGNKLVVTSGDSRIEVDGIEDVENAVTNAGGTLTLGETIDVYVTLGPTSKITSLGSSLSVTCKLLPVQPPSPPVVTTPTYTG